MLTGHAVQEALQAHSDRARLLNPFLAHRLADIAQNHEQKKQRRFAPLLALADEYGLGLAMPRLRADLSNPG